MSTISTLADNYRLTHAILDENLLEPQIATFARALVNSSNELSLDASDLPAFSDSGDAVILTVGAYTATFTFTGTTGLTFPTAGTLATRAGTETLTNKTLTSALITTSLAPTTNDGAPLGNTGSQFSDLFLASGGVLNFANGDVAVTHSSGILTMGTGEFRITTVGTNAASVPTLGSTSTLTNKSLTSPVLTTATVTTSLKPTTDDGAPLGDTTHNFSDLFLATGAVLNFQAGNVVLTHSSGILTLGTGELRITTVGTNTASVVTVGGAQTLTAKTFVAPVLGAATGTSLALTAGVRFTPTVYTSDGAIGLTSGLHLIEKTSAAAMTVAAPSSQDGDRLIIQSNTDFAHVVTFTGATLLDGTTGANLTVTMTAFKGSSIVVIARGTKWLLESSSNVTSITT